jgi:hypothetical protein
VADEQFRAATYDTGFVSRVVARQLVATDPSVDDGDAFAEG